MKPKNVFVMLLSVAVISSAGSFLEAQQSNFSISPPPIPYPYFDDGRSDISAGGSYISITTSDMTLKGILADIKGRQAFGGLIAFDVNAGLGALTGTMPGIPPLSMIYTSGAYSYVPYYTRVTGDATLNFLSMMANGDLEFQPVKTDHFGIIFFCGITLTMSQMTISTPYELIVPPPYSNAGQTFSGYTHTLTVSSYPYGYQAGIQMDIAFDKNFRIAPFFFMNTVSGSATMVSSPGTSGGSAVSYSADIPSSTSYSYGLDIIIGDLSIGTVLQQLQSAGEQNKGAKVIMISAGYHFSTGEEAADNEPLNEEPEEDLQTMK